VRDKKEPSLIPRFCCDPSPISFLYS